MHSKLCFRITLTFGPLSQLCRGTLLRIRTYESDDSRPLEGQKSSRDSPMPPRLGRMLEQLRFRCKGKLAEHRTQLAGPAVSLVQRFR